MTVSRCGNKFQGKEGQNYFTVPRHSKIKISFYKGIDTGVRLSLFYSHCSVSGAFSVSSNLKSTNSRTCKYKTFRFKDSFDRGNDKRAAMVGGEPTSNQRENLDKFTAPNDNINRCFLEGWELIADVKRERDLGNLRRRKII